MKKGILSIISLLLLSSVAHADPINIISESHHILGKTVAATNYDIYSTTPQALKLTHEAPRPDGGFETVGVLTETRHYCVYTEAWGTLSSHAIAESKYIFTSEEDDLLINYSGLVTDWDDVVTGYASISLVDLFDNSELLFDDFDLLLDCSEAQLEFDNSFLLRTSIGHNYALNIYARSVADEGSNRAHLCVAFSPAPVPEPATMLLFGTGIFGLVGARLRKKIK